MKLAFKKYEFDIQNPIERRIFKSDWSILPSFYTRLAFDSIKLYSNKILILEAPGIKHRGGYPNGFPNILYKRCETVLNDNVSIIVQDEDKNNMICGIIISSVLSRLVIYAKKYIRIDVIDFRGITNFNQIMNLMIMNINSSSS